VGREQLRALASHCDRLTGRERTEVGALPGCQSPPVGREQLRALASHCDRLTGRERSEPDR